ncbi:MFS transporter [Merismopedia glauca]|uniref:Arabinose efflux permease n=1 Tax=Merismopedia glauca CCAP 1448/3 TaxID=1296344 RepID=A0A2T1C1F2_9CYAN|nr:MFS transporter [Merismopedia glauca]PSB01998.1 arabinose efflux permease [Merismopedia glauca CCAP 1448/3]
MRLSESEPTTPQPKTDISQELSALNLGEEKPTSPVDKTPIAENIPTAISEGESNIGFGPVLRNRNFLTLWSGQVFSQLADKIYLVLIIAIVANRFQSENQTISGWVSALMMAFTIPAVLFGSLAGVYVDRWPKKLVLIGTNLLRGALVLSIPLLLAAAKGVSLGGLPLGFYILLVITLAVSTLTQLFAPAEQATIPMLVAKDNLLSANSLYTTTMIGSLIVGFAVGQPVLDLADHLFQYIGLPWNVGKELVVGGSYTLAGLILIFLNGKEAKLPLPGESPHVLQDIKDGVDYINRQPRIRSALIQLIILFSVFASMTVLVVRLAEIIPGMKASQFGFLLAAGGVGMGLGAAFLGHYGQKFPASRLTFYGSIGFAASLIGLSFFNHSLWGSLVMMALMGLSAAPIAIPMQTTIQGETPEEMRGKVFGLQNNATNIALSLPLAFTGVAETFLGLQVVLIVLAAIVLAGRLLTWYICRTGANT